MTSTRPAGRRAATTTDRPVFSDPSGRRWKLLRRTGLVLLALFGTAVGVAVPHVLAPPALAGGPRMDGPDVASVGTPPVIGQGPLIRVVKLLRTGGAVYAQDPSGGAVLAQLDPSATRQAGQASYVIQRYGYSAAAHKTISLTFDDGPDPVYTPKLLDLLSRNHVPATFFVTGAQMAQFPAIMQREVREGFALGNHSLTHTDVNGTTAFREQLEIALTDRIMRAETGRYSSYFRLPYEGSDTAEVQADAPGILRAQRDGYLVVSHDFDTEDWAIEAGALKGPIAMPPLGEQDNITVLLHDAGGNNRTATLAYVQKLIPAARAAGYTFQTMPQVQPWLQSHTGVARVTFWDRLTLWCAMAVFALPKTVLFALFVLALVSMLGFGLLNTALAVARARWGRRRPATATPSVSVVIAAYNEEAVIRRTLEHVLVADYPVGEVIVVDDGSRDGTAAEILAVAADDNRVRLLRQPNGGKWSALNRGFAESQHEFVVTLDADTLFTPHTIRNLMARFHSERVGAVAGVIKVANYRRNVITRWQALEYVTQIGVDRSAAALFNGVMIIPGACAAWRRSAVLESGSYSNATMAEDCDLTLMLHQHRWRVEQADDAIAWTEAPETADALLKQRVRWMYGTLQATWRHRNMIFRPRYGWLGMVVMPLSVLTTFVPLIFTPFITWLLLDMLFSQGPAKVLLYFGLFSLLYGVLAGVAVALLGERPHHLLMVPVYRLIYEPLRAYLLYACVGTALRGVLLGWHKLDRTAHVDRLVLPWTSVATAPARSVQ
jgi:cellulose synthase/poly-beta-1,6-N-acetylglucosamine synthase-like glycosyltransferase/peptidoglycan/xylan/chitin deacetylase (PgdA/CDA1 family)